MNAPPPDFDDVPETGRTALGQSLDGLAARLTSIEHLEAERTGASKLTSRLLAVFGALGTAIAIAFGGIVWNANAEDAARDALIDRLDEKVDEHNGSVRELGEGQNELERRVDGVDANVDALTRRMDRQVDQLDELLERMPARRRPR